MKKILILEDEFYIRTLLRRQLKEVGYHALEVEDGESALKLLEQDSAIKLVVLDILLPNISGIEIFERIKRGFPDVKIIVSSVFAIDEQEFLIKNADDYYYKSGLLSDLVEKVRRCLQ